MPTNNDLGSEGSSHTVGQGVGEANFGMGDLELDFDLSSNAESNSSVNYNSHVSPPPTKGVNWVGLAVVLSGGVAAVVYFLGGNKSKTAKGRKIGGKK